MAAPSVKHLGTVRSGDIFVWHGNVSEQALDQLNRFAKSQGVTDILQIRASDRNFVEVLPEADKERLLEFLLKTRPRVESTKQ